MRLRYAAAVRIRRRSPGRRLLGPVAALLTASLVLSACSTGDNVEVVTVTSTPGQAAPSTTGAQVTVPGQSPAVGTGAVGTGSVGTAAPSGRPSGSAVSSSSRLNIGAAVQIAATPKFGSVDVAPNTPVSVTVFAGTIKSLTVKADDGVAVNGAVSQDGSTWTLSERLNYQTKYTFAGVALAADGRTPVPIKGALTTVDPGDNTIRAGFQRQISNGATVGVGTSIILTFFTAIQDKAAAQRTLKVTTSRGVVEGSWGWLQDEDTQKNGNVVSQVHFRPKEFWPAHTKVHVQADLRGVNYGNGWGREDISADFTIGRDQRVEADTTKFQMIVFRDGKIVENYPVSYGAESEPGRTTVSGIHIITDKFLTFSMCNPTYDYCNVTEPWAVRINNNGEFIHENAKVEKQGLLGFANVSHGCINMGAKDAEEFWRSVLYGDPVNVTGTQQKMSEKDFIYDWKYTWDEWKKLSLLNT